MKNTASIYDRLTGFSVRNSISNSALKEVVIRDLLSLLNTNSYYTDKHADIEYSYQSVINYGIHPSIKYDSLNQLAIEAWYSNRALVREISWTLDEDLTFGDKYKVNQIVRQCRFTEPLNAPVHTVELWRLMNLISANFIVNELQERESLTNQIKK